MHDIEDIRVHDVISRKNLNPRIRGFQCKKQVFDIEISQLKFLIFCMVVKGNIEHEFEYDIIPGKDIDSGVYQRDP